jgi:uncharacterized OsmC-like protein
LLGAALGACTAMTLRMYADFKKLPLGAVTVDVSHAKVHASDCAECSEEERNRTGARSTASNVTFPSRARLPPELADKLEQIANKCPVHKTLEGDFEGRDRHREQGEVGRCMRQTLRKFHVSESGV